MSTNDQKFDALADLIRWENPYGYEMTLPDSLDADGVVESAGLTSLYNAARPFRTTAEELTPSDQMECLYWPFEGRTHRLSKALRIPYTFVRTEDGQERMQTGSILVGYEGPVWP